MVETRRIGRFGDVQAIIDAIHHHLQHCSDDPATAWATGNQPGFTVFHHNGRRHRRQRAFVRPDGVGITAHQPVNVRYARFGGEIIHLVIKQNTALARDNTRTEGGVQRIGHRHRVTVFIHYRVMGSLITLIRRKLARANLTGRLRFVDINLIGNGFGIGFIGQCLPRDFDKIRVAKIFRAVGVGVFLRFCHDLHRIGAAKAVFLHIEVFQNIEDLYDMDPAGGWRWHGVNLIPAIIAAYRSAFDRFIGR